MHTIGPSRCVALLALFVLLVMRVGAASEAQPDAGSTPGGAVVTLLDPGAAPRVALRFTPNAGDTSASELVTRVSVQRASGGAPAGPVPPMKMVVEMTVEDVAESGDITFTAHYLGAGVLDEPGVSPMMRDQMAAALSSMNGTTVKAVVSNRGMVRRADMELASETNPMVRQQLEGIAASLDQFAAPLPEEAVGVGATWKTESRLTQGEVLILQTATYVLTAIDGSALEMEIDVVQVADPQDVESPMLPPGATMRLRSIRGEGKGATKLDLSSIMPTEAEMHMTTDTDLSMDVDGQQHDVSQAIKFVMSLRPAVRED